MIVGECVWAAETTNGQAPGAGCTGETGRSAYLCVTGERYVPGVGQVEPFDEVRREIIHQLSIRPMAHSELVKALPENVRCKPKCCSSVYLNVCRSVGLCDYLFS